MSVSSIPWRKTKDEKPPVDEGVIAYEIKTDTVKIMFYWGEEDNEGSRWENEEVPYWVYPNEIPKPVED